MEITFPNPSTPRHDRNPKRRINYGLTGQRELADQGQSWHRSILDLVPRLNKYLRTFGDWGRTEIDEVHLWIFPESDGRWYRGEGFCALLHLIFATDKEVMNPKWRLASRTNKHLDFLWGSNTQEEHWTPLLFIQKVKIIDKNIFLFISWLFTKASEKRLMSIYLSFYSLTIDRIQWSGGVEWGDQSQSLAWERFFATNFKASSQMLVDSLRPFESASDGGGVRKVLHQSLGWNNRNKWHWCSNNGQDSLVSEDRTRSSKET